MNVWLYTYFLKFFSQMHFLIFLGHLNLSPSYYHIIMFHFSGAPSKKGPAVDYLLCKSIIEDVVKTVYTDKPKDLLNQKIVAFSYFYDRAQDAGLVSMY